MAADSLTIFWRSEFQDGDDLFLRKRPGRAKFGNVTLKKGYIVTSDLQDWWRACRDGQYDRRDISIILNDNAGNEIRRWNLYGCWPKQWKISGFDGKGTDAATEEIVFVVERDPASAAGTATGTLDVIVDGITVVTTTYAF